jgi:hypothetical protein
MRAHAFGGLSACVDSLLDQPPEAFPFNRLTREATSAARRALRGKPAETVATGDRQALRATIFRFELVMRINVVTHEMIECEDLIYAALAGMLGMLTSDDRPERLTNQSYRSRLAQCRDVTVSRVDELLAPEQARSVVEERYLDGRVALFPDDRRDWAERLVLARDLAVMADRIAELDGLEPAAPISPEAMPARVAVLVADLVEPSRASTRDKLDEGRSALAIATSWLRSKNATSRAEVAKFRRGRPGSISRPCDGLPIYTIPMGVGHRSRGSSH